MSAVMKAEMFEPAPRPLLRATGVTRWYDQTLGCANVDLSLYPGEVLGIVGESGSGKSTLLACLAALLQPSAGSVEFDVRSQGLTDIYQLSEPRRRQLMRTEWGIVHQNPRDGLRMNISAGGNVGERLMAAGATHYGEIRREIESWMGEVELDRERADESPRQYSGGMQQRLQLARVLVSKPRLVFMDEPTGGLDVSVQARLLDLLRTLVRELGVAAIVVTHDIAVVRLLADRLMVMRAGEVVEAGLTDQVLDDPHHPYTQLLVSSVLQA